MSIWEITGPGLYIALLRDPADPARLVPRWQSTVRIIRQAETPVRFYAHRAYRDPERHWRTRERTEPILSDPV